MTADASRTWTSAGVVFVGNLIARGLGFLFPVVLARAVGRGEFALTYFYVSAAFFVAELVLAGFPTAMTRFLAAPAATARGTWLTAAVVAGVPLLAASIAGGAVLATVSNASPTLLAAMVIGLTIDAYYFAALRGVGAFALLVGYRISANLVQLLIVLVLGVTGSLTVEIAVLAYAFSYLVPIAAIEATRGPVRRLAPLRAAAPSRADYRAIVGLGLPALVSGVAYATIFGLDVTWVRLSAPAALPDYGAARTLAMPMTLVPFAVAVVLLPRVAASDWPSRMTLLAQAVALTAGASALAIGGYVLLAPVAVALVYPVTYEGAASVLPLLAFGLGILGVYSILSQWWFGIARSTTPAACLVTGAIAATLAHVALDPGMGAMGAALAIVVGATLATVLLGIATVHRVRRVALAAD